MGYNHPAPSDSPTASSTPPSSLSARTHSDEGGSSARNPLPSVSGDSSDHHHHLQQQPANAVASFGTSSSSSSNHDAREVIPLSDDLVDTGPSNSHHVTASLLSSSAYRYNAYGNHHQATTTGSGWRGKRRRWWRARVRYYIPILGWLPTYNLKDLRSDIRAGFTVACLLIPQALSYGSLTHLKPINGLYTALMPVLVYALLGTSRHLSMGPEALISILVGSTVVDQVKHLYLNNGDPSEEEVLEYSRALVSTVCMLVGILATALGLARFGFMDSILAEPALRGFITGAACVIIIDQLMPLLGLKVPPGDADELLHASPITRIRYLLDHLDGISRVALAIGVGSLVFLVAMRFVKRRWRRVGAIRNIPEILVTVVAATIVSWFVRLDTRGVVVLGSVDATFPMPRLPRLPSEVNPRDVLSTAITITVIGVTESLIVAREYASRNHYSVSSNRELVAIGMSNFVGAFFGAYPAFGSLTRSKLNDRSGGRSQLSGLVIFAFVLTSLLWLLPLLQYLPKPVLCAIIVNTALSLLTRTPREVRFLANIRAWDDLLLLFVIFAVTVLGSVDMGLLLAVAISVVVVIKRSNMPKITLLGRPTTAANPSATTTFTATQGIPRASDLSMVPTTLSGSSGRQHVTFRPIQQLSSPRARPGHPRQPATPNAVYSGVTSHNEPGFGYSDDEFEDDEGEDEDERVELVEGVLIIRIEEPLYFANTNQLQARLRRLELYGDMRVHPSESARLAPVQAVIFDVASMPSLDGSAMSTLSNIVTQYHLRNVIVGFVDTVPAVMEMFKLSGLYDRVGSDMFFDSIQHALEYLESLAVVPQPVAMVGVVTQDSHLDYFSDAGF